MEAEDTPDGNKGLWKLASLPRKELASSETPRRSAPRPDRIWRYVAELRARVSPRSVVTQLRSLSQAVAALDPGADRETLKLAISRLERIAAPSRLKSGSLKVTDRTHRAGGAAAMSTWRKRHGA